MTSPTLKQVPYGEASFAYLRKAGWAYVDKTPFIRTLEESGSRFHALMRPRRFGKSLFANMLAAYYDKAAADDFETNFAGTWIAQHLTPSAKRYLVLKFDFSGVGGSREAITAGFILKLKAGIWQFVKRYLWGNPQIEAVLDKDHPTPSALLTEFLTTVQSLVNDRIFLIIDEYDHLAQRFFSKDRETLDSITGTEGLLTNFYAVIQAFSESLIERAFITGVTSMSMNLVTSGLSHATDISNCPSFSSCLGFTDEELRKLIPEVVDTRRYGRSVDEILERMKALYDGYRFSPESDVTVVNSSMALYYLCKTARDNCEPLDLMVPSFSTGLSKIEPILSLGRPEFVEEVVLNVLWEKTTPFESAGGTVDLGADGKFSREGVLTFLVFMGFLTLSAANSGFLVCPNPVVKEVFFKYWFRRLGRTEDLSFPPTALKKAVDSLKAGDAEPLLALITDRLKRCIAGNAHARLDETSMLLAVSMALCTQMDYQVTAKEKGSESGCAQLTLRTARLNNDAAAWRFEFENSEGTIGGVKALLVASHEKLTIGSTAANQGNA